MVAQQIGLDCKSSKKSPSAKAAHHSNANAVYLFLSVCFCYLAPLFLSLTWQWWGSVKHHIKSENALTGAYTQRGVFNADPERGPALMQHLRLRRGRGTLLLTVNPSSLPARYIYFFFLDFIWAFTLKNFPSLPHLPSNMNTHSYRTLGRINI